MHLAPLGTVPQVSRVVALASDVTTLPIRAGRGMCRKSAVTCDTARPRVV